MILRYSEILVMCCFNSSVDNLYNLTKFTIFNFNFCCFCIKDFLAVLLKFYIKYDIIELCYIQYMHFDYIMCYFIGVFVRIYIICHIKIFVPVTRMAVNMCHYVSFHSIRRI